MAFVHTPYNWLLGVDTDIKKGVPTTDSCLERVPSIRQWWQAYLTGLCVFEFTSRNNRTGRNPRAVDAVCDELITHTVSVFGADGGSLASEMVQNAVMQRQPILYELVVGRLFRRRWHAFLLQYTDILTLVARKTVGSSPEWCWRLYQTQHGNQWEAVDAARTLAQHRFEERIQAAVVGLLEVCPRRSCHVWAVVWHLNPLLVHEGQHRPLRPVRLLQMVDVRPDLFTSKVEPNGAVTIHLI